MKLSAFTLLFLLIYLPASAQHASAVDFKHLKAELAIDPLKAEVSGELVYTLEVLKETDSIFIDARKMTFSDVFFNGEAVEYGSDDKKLWLVGDFGPSEKQQIQIKYKATPEQAIYFIPEEQQAGRDDFQTWTQGQGKYTSSWLPSFDDTREKLEFDLSFIYPAGTTLIANGKLLHSEEINDSLVRWDFDMQQPMSSYLVALAAGNFDSRKEVSASGIPLEFYYPAGRKDRAEPTYRHSVEIMDFLEQEIGIPYPWQNYKQIPVRDFLYAGMENTGTTIFSDLFLVDSIGYNDRNYANVDAHELAHQWFGNLVTAENGQHHWLQEGFATYYALLAEKALFGEDYFYRKLFETAEELKQMSDTGKGEALLNPNASSLTFYQKGAWALHILKEKIGKEAFDRGVKNYLLKNAYSSVTTEDFIAEMEQASGQDLSEFVKNWLEQSAFQGTEALESLKKSSFIQQYLEIAALKPLPISRKRDQLKAALDFPVNDFIGQEVVYQLALEDPSEVIELYKKAFDSGNLYARQAIAFSLQDIPQELKQEYENLLNDESYASREAALYNLWRNFPAEALNYLRQTEAAEGFLDKNIRTLWLALNLATPEVPAARKRAYFKELSGYTAPHHRFQLRQKAFEYLFQLNAFDSESLYNLMDAARHHNYRFREFAKEMLKSLTESGRLKPEEQEDLRQKVEENRNRKK